MESAVQDTAAAASGVRWAKVIDQTKCIGCHACSTACKSENHVPISVHRTYVKYVDVGTFPNARRAFQVTRCNHCQDAPCTHACPTAAMYARSDGIVDFDKSVCIGCKACIAACPYDAIFINPEDHSAEKCNFCAQRIDMNLEPACVVVCPTEAILVGDLNEPRSKVTTIVGREPVAVRRPEKETRPKLFYTGAHQATLDPLAAKRPDGGLFVWSEQGRGPHGVAAGHPRRNNSAAQALLAYDVPHHAPWDWRLSLYTWTKSLAAGAYLIPALLALLGILSPEHVVWKWIAPALSATFLVLTGLILIADLDRPGRFWLIFARPQWRSWLVRGAFIILGFGLVLVIHLLTNLLAGGAAVQGYLMLFGIPLGVLTAVYTAYLFAQATARDLWQSPLLPPHFLVQAMLAGAAALMPCAVWSAPDIAPAVATLLGAACALHLLLVAGEMTLAHPTAHARLAASEMTAGKYRAFFWAGSVLILVGINAVWLGAAAATAVAFAALVGLLAHEHAYVQAGQSVPLA